MSARGKMTEKAEVVIAALLTEPTHAAAAARAGIGEATVQRCLRKKSFLRLYRAARRRVVEAAIGQVQQLTSEAVQVFRRNLTCGVPAVELRAAALVLAQAIKGGGGRRLRDSTGSTGRHEWKRSCGARSVGRAGPETGGRRMTRGEQRRLAAVARTRAAARGEGLLGSAVLCPVAEAHGYPVGLYRVGPTGSVHGVYVYDPADGEPRVPEDEVTPWCLVIGGDVRPQEFEGWVRLWSPRKAVERRAEE
ncbi:MAG: hypothetical protein JWO38_4541 [Gemmataceae bacterium]|nr:hypothetical protein [Gemmataceae bacterium]